jgi:hypothetical protein
MSGLHNHRNRLAQQAKSTAMLPTTGATSSYAMLKLNFSLRNQDNDTTIRFLSKLNGKKRLVLFTFRPPQKKRNVRCYWNFTLATYTSVKDSIQLNGSYWEGSENSVSVRACRRIPLLDALSNPKMRAISVRLLRLNWNDGDALAQIF